MSCFLQAMTTLPLNPAERMIVGAIGALLALVILLLGYAVMLRLSFNRRNAYGERRVRAWEPLVLEYLEGKPAEASRFALRTRDWMLFGGFIGEYLENLKGAEYERLLDLLREVRFERQLMRQVRKRSRWKRAYAVQFLSLMRYRPAAGLFMSMLRDRSSVVAFSALDALRMLDVTLDFDRVIRETLQRDDLGFPKLTEVISGFGPQAHPALIRLLEDPSLSSGAKRLIVDILADNRVAESVPAILALLNDAADEELVIGCIKALGMLEAPEALETLTGYLGAPNWIVRSQAVRSVGAVGGGTEIPLLTGLLRGDDNFWVRQYSAQALMRLGPDGVAALRAMRDDSSLSPETGSIIGFMLEERGAR